MLPAFEHFQSAMFLEDDGSGSGVFCGLFFSVIYRSNFLVNYMSTLATTLSPTDAGRTEILARHLFNEERTAENADLDLEQYIQKLDGLHVGECCLAQSGQ